MACEGQPTRAVTDGGHHRLALMLRTGEKDVLETGCKPWSQVLPQASRLAAGSIRLLACGRGSHLLGVLDAAFQRRRQAAHADNERSGQLEHGIGTGRWAMVERIC